MSNTIDDFPEPETPVKIVIFRLGIAKRDVLQVVLARAADLDEFVHSTMWTHCVEAAYEERTLRELCFLRG